MRVEPGDAFPSPMAPFDPSTLADAQDDDDEEDVHTIMRMSPLSQDMRTHRVEPALAEALAQNARLPDPQQQNILANLPVIHDEDSDEISRR